MASSSHRESLWIYYRLLALIVSLLPTCSSALIVRDNIGIESSFHQTRGRSWQSLLCSRSSRRRVTSPFASTSPSTPTPEDEAQRFLDEAKRLCQEVAELERSKQSSKPIEQVATTQKKNTVLAQQSLLHRYEAVVPILLADGTVKEEEVEFMPFYKDGASYITTSEARLPLGIVLGECEAFSGAVSVDEVAPGGNGEQAGLKVGDLVRAFTACRMQMDQPAWQLMAGGIGIPKTFRFMYSSDKKPFEEVMDAIVSNRMDPQERPVLLVIERVDD